MPDGLTRVSVKGPTLDLSKTLLPAQPPSFPDVFFAPIGAVLAQWSAFEGRHDRLLECLVLHNGGEIASIPRGFERRRKRFKQEASMAFSDCPNLLKYIREMLGEVKPRYRVRNMIAHGHLSCVIDVNLPAGVIGTTDHVNVMVMIQAYQDGDAVEAKMGVKEFEEMFYDLMHLSGRLIQLEDANPAIPDLEPHETSALRAFQASALPDGPIPNMRPNHEK